MTAIKDEKIISGLKNGDKAIIDYLYAKYHKRIYAFAYSLLKVEEDSMDVVHEVFIKLWEKRKELNKNSRIEHLFFTITRNTVLSMFRKMASERKYQKNILNIVSSNNVEASTENLVDYYLLKEKLDEIVAKLPNKSRLVYILSREKGYSNKEISVQLNIAEKTVEDHLTRALKFIRQNMKKAGIAGLLFWHLFVI
ncbi:RNA polymerase sigma factor [Thermophagus xiamenensis]|jgi:RNA polymerase sigma-70 factor (ECF subfamily)|uniref:RNA polymerase sigma-70 factor, ECF subfamily n=1 Tax=Thermophagus xiamenensis TaxID=385682 RepID=A0A1I2DSG6_9BACT|nr:RNA polymerase sigma-70 factor [Thermophagus xiamenensis]SFE83466.1 RNA polymerase sigma-70 factor, ECF subfamily [Thermophagus xiamenensis]